MYLYCIASGTVFYKTYLDGMATLLGDVFSLLVLMVFQNGSYIIQQIQITKLLNWSQSGNFTVVFIKRVRDYHKKDITARILPHKQYIYE